jgi:N-acetyl sugar amidotransferase
MVEATLHNPQAGPAPGAAPKKVYKTCTRCVMDERAPKIRFDADGVCTHCHVHDMLARMFPTGEQGDAFLKKMADRMKRDGRGRQYDCIVGLSGGRDTTYCLYKCVQLGLRPLAVHFDNGWDSEIAKNNIQRVCDKLDVDLHTIIADWEESRELTNCTIRASLPYIDLTDDIGIVRALYDSAAEEGVRWIIHSHSFRTEGINPLLWNYVDGRLVRSLIRRFGRMQLKHFKNVDLRHFLYWAVIKRINVFTITNHYDDADAEIDEFLKREFGWQDTGGWHFDNEIFGLQCYYTRHKFGFDWRMVEVAALVREGLMSRAEGLAKLDEVPAIERKEIVDYALKKQGISEAEFAEIMAAEPKYFTDYPTYYPILKLFRLPIKWLCRMNVLPPHAYEKYFEL